MSPGPVLREFADRAAASQAAADMLVERLGAALARSGRASLVVSGGTTPGDCFDLLSSAPLPWSGVTVVPSDERWLPADHADSNERLIRSRLLRGPAAAARLLPLYRRKLTPQQAATQVAGDLQSLAGGFSASLLGMGADGHFASLFPDFAGLADSLDPASPARCVVVQTASSPYVRLSLTLPALLTSGRLVLLFFGQEKRRVYEAALAGTPGYPVAALLAQAEAGLTACWAP